MMKLPTWRAEWLAIALAALLVAAFNIPFWQRMLQILQPLDARGVGMLAMSAVFLTAFLALFIQLLLWPRIGKPLLMLILLLSAAISYFMLQYGVMVDVNMFRNAVQTDPAEVRDLLSFKLLLTVLLLGGVPCWLLYRSEVRYRPWWRELLARGIALLLTGGVLVAVALIAYQDFASLFRNNRDLRYVINPVNYIGATQSYLKRVSAKPQALQVIAADARQVSRWPAGSKPRVLVLVVGETARAANFGLNGYARQTTPQLAKVAGLLNYPDVWSCGTETAVSVPCMFSIQPRATFDADTAKQQQNLLDVLQRSKVTVNWWDNNSGCKGVCARVPTEMRYERKDGPWCTADECFDEVLLDGLPQRLAAARADEVIVLHQKGSHGPAYYKRYPAQFARFQPVCQTSELQKCSSAEITNAYDNTVLYTDHFLSRVIASLQAQDKVAASMLYLSDHGESLGENNLYLHGTPYMLAPDVQKHIPLVAWFSPTWQQAAKLDMTCLDKSRKQRYSQDNLFHSVLGLMGIHSSSYQRELDMFASCRQG